MITYHNQRITNEQIDNTFYHEPINGLKIQDVFIPITCQKQQCKKCVSKNLKVVIKNLKHNHGIENLTLANIETHTQKVQIQYLSGKKDRFLLLKPDNDVNDNVDDLPNHDTNVLQQQQQDQFDIYEQIFDEIPLHMFQQANEQVTTNESIHARNITLLEHMTNWKHIVLPTQVDTAFQMLNPKNKCLPPNFHKQATDLFFQWMIHLKEFNATAPEFMKRSVAANCQKRHEFNTVENSNRRYPEVMATLFQWMILACQIDTTTTNTTQQPNDTPQQLPIPEQWIVNNEQLLQDATSNLWMHSGIAQEQEQHATAQSHDVYHWINQFLLTCLARNAILHIHQHDPFDCISVFLVAATLRTMFHAGGKCNAGNSTSKIAALEYALRGAVLFEAHKRCDQQLQLSNGDANSRLQITNETSQYIETWTNRDHSNNSVAFLLHHFKRQIKTYATQEGNLNVHFHDTQFLDHTIMAQKCTRVMFLQLQQGIQQAIQELTQTCDALMQGFWINPNTLDPQHIHDNLACQENDYAFWTDPANQELLPLPKKWYTMQVGKNEQWIARFLDNCQNIQELILFLLHTTSGGPGRSTTMVATKLYNLDGYPRCLQIFQGDLYFVSLYEKTQATTLFENQSAKFIAPVLHKPILQYLLIFKKNEDGFRAIQGQQLDHTIFRARQRHLFCSNNGAMHPNQYRQIINERFIQYANIDLGIAGWRHSFTALAERHVYRKQKNTNPTDNNNSDDIINIANDQMGHSNVTAEKHYGKSDQSHSMGTTYMAQVKQFGMLWQAFLLGNNVNYHNTNNNSRKPLLDNTAATHNQHANNYDTNPSSYNVNQTTNNVYNINISSGTIHNAMQQIHGPPSISNWSEQRLRNIYQAIHQRKLHPTPFRNHNVQQCFDTIMTTHPGDFICILPTGSGKSLIYQYMAISDLQQVQDVVVVIIPLKELLENQILISQRLQLPFMRYDKNKPTNTMVDDMHLQGPKHNTKKLVFVQVEHVNAQFFQFLQQLNHTGRLGKIVFDEFHLYLVHQHIRQAAFHSNQHLLQAFSNVGRIFLSATVEIKQETELLNMVALGVGHGTIPPITLRYGKIPSNIGFFVRHCTSLDECQTIMATNLRRAALNNDNTARFIVFVMTVSDLEIIENHLRQQLTLPVTTLHSKMDEPQKDKNRRFWMQRQQCIMVATVAFSHGVDYHNVPYIAIYRGIYELTTLLQCAGRGGRGDNTHSILQVFCDTQDYQTHNSHCQTKCSQDFCNWINCQQRCRRNMLAHAFYGHTEICNFQTLPCDHCLTIATQTWETTTEQQQQWQWILMDDDSKPAATNQQNHTNQSQTVTTQHSSTANKPVLVSQTSPMPNPYCRKRPRPSQGENVQPTTTTTHIQQETGVQHIPFPNLNDTQAQNLPINLNYRHSETTQVFYAPQQQYSNEEQLLVDTVPKNACGFCFGKELASTLVEHNTNQCPYARKSQCCYKCIGKGHTSNQCFTKTFKRQNNYCNRCMISINAHRGNGFGNTCQLQANDFTWTVAWYVYRHHTTVFQECMANINQGQQHTYNTEMELCHWMVAKQTKPPCALNVTRLVAALLLRHKVRPTNK